MTILIEGPRSVDPDAWAAHAAALREELDQETDASNRASIEAAIARADAWSEPVEAQPIAADGTLAPALALG